jgi:5-methylcytosine-specific restriction endonuclease McrA
MAGPRAYTPRTVKKLYALAKNTCSNPDCRRTLVIAGKKSNTYGQLGKIAHIRGAEPTSPRYDETMSDDQRRAFENLILLCSECHDRVDDVELQDDYPVDLLTSWKTEHEDNSWQPSDQIESWGKIIIQEEGEQIELPYFRTGEGLHFFTEEQWSKVDAAFWIYVEIVEIVGALVGALVMNENHIKQGLYGPNSITREVERQFKPHPQTVHLLPDTEDPSIYESPASRIFSLMQGSELTLDQTLWLATNSQTTIVATSIDSVAELD